MSPSQRRAAGFDDVAVAQKHARKPNAPTRGVPGYAFNVIAIRHGMHRGMISQIQYKPFGVYTSMEECDMARAQKIAELDEQDRRFPHQVDNPPVVSSSTTVLNGAGAAGPLSGTITTQQYGRAPSERQDVTFCEPGVYSPESTNNIAKRSTTQ